jgi:hypothetical protein
MAHNFLKIVGLTALSLGWSLGLPQAAASPPPPPPPPPADAKPLFASPGSGPLPKMIKGTKATTTGWNSYTCYANTEYYDGTYWWFGDYNEDGSQFWYPVGTGGLWWAIEAQLQQACYYPSYWVYCPNSSCTGWSQITIYTR